MSDRLLTFVEATPEAFAAACRQHLDAGRRRIRLTPGNGLGRAVYQLIEADVERAGGHLLVDRDTPPAAGRGRPIDDADLIVVTACDEPDLSRQLLGLQDLTAAVVAPAGPKYWARHPLFLISIPKAGTHLLYSFAAAMGYKDSVVFKDDPAPGSWYCVEYSNSHTVARDFFVDTVRRSPFGNRDHPFMRSPALFIYRNPLDIVASEANYYHRDGMTAFAGYLEALTPEQRLLHLIDDPWLLGTIRDRVGGFIPWLELPNVVPVSFEELIGPHGGGSADLQQRTIWSIQLKLHVPGSPDRLAATLFNRDSPSFDRAQIGRYQDVFTEEAYQRFFDLPQDFMRAYGYDEAAPRTIVRVPRRAEEFRRRPVRVLVTRPEVPVTIQDGYLGFNIVRYGDRYFAVNQTDGDIDVRSDELETLQAAGRIVTARTAEEARRGAEHLTVRSLVDRVRVEAALAEEEEARRWVVMRDDCCGYNIVKHERRFFAVAHALGSCDLDAADLPALLASGDLLVADTQHAAEAAAEASAVRQPTLVRAGYHGYNIIKLGHRFYAAAQRLGPFDLPTADIPALLSAGHLLVEGSQRAVEAAVDTVRSRNAPASRSEG